MPDHIHLFISTTPTVALTDVVRTLKSISARELFKRFPKLKHFIIVQVLYGVKDIL